MKVIETGIAGLLVIDPDVFGDERGWFQEEFKAVRYAEYGHEDPIVQINHSFSQKGVLRGLHFQLPPNEQSKIVRCLKGRLYDVAVDIRPDSATCGKAFGVELTEENHKSLIVPHGFAHGFYSITDCELLYFCGNAVYNKESEGGLRYNDPDLKIDWPLDGEPIVLQAKEPVDGLRGGGHTHPTELVLAPLQEEGEGKGVLHGPTSINPRAACAQGSRVHRPRPGRLPAEPDRHR